MNQNAIQKIIMLVLALGVALWLVVEILTGGGNTLGKFYLFSAIGAFVTGLVAPRFAVILSLFCTAYIDLFKRLMVFDSYLSFMDLYYVLGIPPLLIAGSVLSVLLGVVIRRIDVDSSLILNFCLSCALFLLGIFAINDSTGYRSLGDIVNQGAYAFFFFLLPVLFKSVEERRRLLNWMMYLFLGVAIYMFRHRYFGLADFEYRYLLSGLTIEKRILTDQEALRGFSTMNGASVVSVFTSMMILVCMVPLKRENKSPSFIQWIGRFAMAIVFLLASYYTVSRGGWFCGLGAVLVYLLLKSRALATFGAISAVGGLVLLIGFAPMMQKARVLEETEKSIKKLVLSNEHDAFAERAIVLGTANDRLQGWVNLTQTTQIWQPFGFKAAGLKDKSQDFIWGHDLIIDTLITVGWVPPLILGALAFWWLIRAQRWFFSLPYDSLERKVVRLSFALAVGILVGGLGNGQQLRVYPQNFYFYLFLGIIYTSYRNSVKESKRLRAASAPRDFRKLEGVGNAGAPA